MNRFRKVWRKIDPKLEAGTDHWPLEKGALYLHSGLLLICPFFWAIDYREPESDPCLWDAWRVAWVLGWLGLLIVMWATNPTGAINDLFAVLAGIRLLEILTTGLGTVLDRPQQAHARSLVTIAIYVLQVALIFAIIDHSWAGSAFVASHDTHAARAFDYLYISWTDMTTLGNSYTAEGVAARTFEMLTAATGLFLVGVLLAMGINRIPKHLR